MSAASMFDLRERRAVVTGGSRGIGLEIARALVAGGARVLIGGRDRAAAERAAAELGGGAAALALDVADEGSVQALATHVQQQWGGLDILVNNAGINPHYASLDKTSTEAWRATLAVNLDGVFFCCRHLGGLMVGQGGGSIVNISSIAGHTGLRKQTPYCASKGGVEQLTKGLALDWAEHGIRVNAVAYGYIDTDLTAGVTEHPHIAPRLLARTPLGRFGRRSEVAGAVVFLASDAASYVTGHTLMVDGGWTAA